MKVFIDTNVLIDYICARKDFYDDARMIFVQGLISETTISFADISVINTLYVGKKFGYSTEDLCNVLQKVLSFCVVSPIDGKVILRALSSTWKDKEDAVQYFSAVKSGADCIVTRNIKDFKDAAIPVMTPLEFLRNM